MQITRLSCRCFLWSRWRGSCRGCILSAISEFSSSSSGISRLAPTSLDRKLSSFYPTRLCFSFSKKTFLRYCSEHLGCLCNANCPPTGSEDCFLEGPSSIQGLSRCLAFSETKTVPNRHLPKTPAIFVHLIFPRMKFESSIDPSIQSSWLDPW